VENDISEMNSYNLFLFVDGNIEIIKKEGRPIADEQSKKVSLPHSLRNKP